MTHVQQNGDGGAKVRGWLGVFFSGMAVMGMIVGAVEFRISLMERSLTNKIDASSAACHIQAESARRELAGAVAERNAKIQGLHDRIVTLESARSNGK